MNLFYFYKKSFQGITRPIWVLSIVMFINRCGMMVIPFLTLYATQAIGFTIVQAGMLTGSFGFGSLCGSWIGGWLSDKIGSYRVIVMSLVGGGIAFMFLLLFTSYYPLMVAIFITSTIIDAARPAIFSAVTTYSKAADQTRSVSLIRMAINLGISIGPAIGGIVAGSIGYAWLFIIDGSTCIIAAIFLLLFLNEKKRVKEVEVINDKAISVYNDRVFLLFIVANLFSLIVFFQVLSTIPLYFEQVMGLSEIQIGLFFTLNGLIIFIFEMPLVYLAEKKGKDLNWVIIGAAMMGAGHWLLNIPGWWLIPFLGYSFLLAFGEIFNFPFSNSIAMKRAKGRGIGAYMGIYTMMFSLSFILAPIIGTQILDRFGYTVLWWTMGSMSMISVFGFYLLREALQFKNG